MSAAGLKNKQEQDFLGEIASYILERAGSDEEIADLAILLPCLRDVVLLQEHIVRRREFTLLPQIFSFESSYRDDLALASPAHEILSIARFLSKDAPADSYLDSIDKAKSLRSHYLAGDTQSDQEKLVLDNLRDSLKNHHLACAIDSRAKFTRDTATAQNLIVAGFTKAEISTGQLKHLIDNASARCKVFTIEDRGKLKSQITIEAEPAIFKDRYDEAKYISKQIGRRSNSTIAIAAGARLRQFYQDYLCQQGLMQQGSCNLACAPAGILAINLCKFLYNQFSASNLMAVLSNPLLASKHTHRLDILLRTKCRFVSSFADLLKKIPEENQEFISWLRSLIEMLNIKEGGGNASSIIKQVMNLSSALVFDANPNEDFDELQNFYSHLYRLDILPQKIRPRDVYLLMGKLQEMKKTKALPANNDLQIISLHEARLQKFDIIFVPSISSNWADDLDHDVEIDNIYHIMYQNHVMISDNAPARGAASILSSKILYMLQNDLNLEFKQYGANNQHSNISAKERDKIVLLPHEFFPGSISASGAEIMARAPYHFYCKKILKLQKIDAVDAPPSGADFGNLLHKAFELYTKNASKQNSGAQYFKSITDGLLTAISLPVQYRRQWQCRLDALGAEFVKFDTARRQASSKILAETQGSIDLEIAGRLIKLTAIADRIEKRADGSIFICDYKTGVLPAKSDILSGLSPQLIIIAIIMLGGGFAQLDAALQTINLEYIKIQSAQPYIMTKCYSFTKEQIAEHKDGLCKLASYYMERGEFEREINLTAFNEYFGM